MIGIYRIVCKTTGIFYIGSSICIEKRWNLHRSDLRRGRHKNPGLQAAWVKFGETAFAFEIVEIVDNPKMVIQRERYFIRVFDAHNEVLGFNVAMPRRTIAGQKIGPPSLKTRQKQRAAALLRGMPPRTAEQNVKLAESQRAAWIRRREKGLTTQSAEGRKSIGDAGRRRFNMMSPEEKRAVALRLAEGLARTGRRPQTQAEIQRRADALRAHRAQNPVSDETKRRMSEGKRAGWARRKAAAAAVRQEA